MELRAREDSVDDSTGLYMAILAIVTAQLSIVCECLS